jgi:tetratricopeptide (TPR) repeat protein
MAIVTDFRSHGRVTAGDRALEAGEWSAARDSFRTALDLGQTAEALNGLGQALWWLGKTQDSIDYRERAYAEFRRRQDPVQAERGDEKLYAEVKGKTTSRPGVGLDTLYGQLLRRCPLRKSVSRRPDSQLLFRRMRRQQLFGFLCAFEIFYESTSTP